MLQFRLWTLLLVFAVVWFSMVVFGVEGLAIGALIVAVIAWLRASREVRLSIAVPLLPLACMALLIWLVWPTIPGGGGGPRRWSCLNNLKEISRALHNYHSAHGRLPPAFLADASGKPMHSWRVLLLPYLDEQPLYDRYDLAEPWDGPNNRELADEILSVYRCPENDKAPTTNYLAVVGPGSVWAEGPSSDDDPDEVDSSEGFTLMVVEVADSGVHWMEPRDLPLDDAVARLRRHANAGRRHEMQHGFFYHSDWGTHAAADDYSVQFLRDGLPEATLQALLTRGADKGDTKGALYSQRRFHWAHALAVAALIVSVIMLFRPALRRAPHQPSRRAGGS